MENSDRTELLKTIHRLKETNTHLQVLLDGSPDVIMQFDKQMRIVWANKTALAKNPLAIGKTCYSAYLSLKHSCAGCPCKKALETGQIEQGVMRVNTLIVPGMSYWEDIAVPLRDDQGQVDGVIKIGRNVTERELAAAELRKHRDHLEELVIARTSELQARNQELEAEIIERMHTEELLRESEEKYSTLIEESLIGIYISQNGKIQFANDKFADIFGYGKDRLTGMPMWQLIHPEDRAKFKEVGLKRTGKKLTPAEYEMRCLTQDGRAIWVTRRNAVIKFKGIPAILGNVVDITERKQMEEELRASESELRMLSTRLVAAEEQERKRIAQELHDGIGQSLSAIKFSAETALKRAGAALEDGSSEFIRDVLPLIKKTIEEVRMIVTDLRPSILDDLGLIPTMKWFFREFQKVYSHIRVESHVLVHEKQIPLPLKIVIYRLLQEAFNNVAKHSGASLVYSSMTLSKGRLEVVIKDNGQGFDLKHILSHENLNRGFGLTNMRERTKLSRGEFFMRSSKGKGTFIKASWPLQEGLCTETLRMTVVG